MSVSDVLSVVSAWLTPCWSFFGLQYPLFGITFKSIFISIALATIALRVVKRVIDSPEGGGNIPHKSGNVNRALKGKGK